MQITLHANTETRDMEMSSCFFCFQTAFHQVVMVAKLTFTCLPQALQQVMVSSSKEGGSLYFYDRKPAEDESFSNLRALKGKRQCFSIFYDVNITTKSKTDSKFSRVSFDEIPSNLADW